MDKKDTFFLLLRFGLGTENVDDGQWAKDDYLSVSDAHISIKQGIGAFIFDGLQKAMETGVISTDAVSREVKMKLFSHIVQVEKLCKSQYAKAAELADIYAQHGIRTVVLKGIAAGQCYPISNHRPCGDLDCFLFSQHERGNCIAEQIGAKVKRGHYKHSHIDFHGLSVENHRFCTGIRGSQRARRFERVLQNILQEEGTKKIGNSQLECPSPLFNALHLTYHSRSHFFLEGIALRHLCDWAMLLHKYGEQIDWERFLNIVEEFGMRQFADAMTRLSSIYLGVKVPKGYVPNVDREREEFLMKEIMYGHLHNVYTSDKSNWMKRWQLVKNVKKNQFRYRLFSDTSFITAAFTLINGFLFDRKPQI